MARDLNKVQLIGRLGSDVEVRHTSAGQSVGQFSLATNNKFKRSDGTEVDQVTWHRIVVWGKAAEVAAQYLKKGSRLYVEGRLNNREWEDRESGEKRRASEIISDEFIFLDGAQSVSGVRAGQAVAAAEPPF